MSSEDPLAVVEWPMPVVTSVAGTRDRLVRRAVAGLSLDPVTPHAAPKPKPPRGWSSRIGYVKDILRAAAEELIPLAEDLATAPKGPEKKALVKKELMTMLRSLEERVNLIPGPAEFAAWWVLGRAVDGIIETVFRQLEARGVVNVGRA